MTPLRRETLLPCEERALVRLGRGTIPWYSWLLRWLP